MGPQAQCQFAFFSWHFANARLFIDADKGGSIDYLSKLLPLVRPGGLIVGHNNNQRQADPKFIETIAQTSALESLLVHGQVKLAVMNR